MVLFSLKVRCWSPPQLRARKIWLLEFFGGFPPKKDRMWGIVINENLLSKLPPHLPPPEPLESLLWKTTVGEGLEQTRGWALRETLAICAPCMLIDQLMLRTNFLVENGGKLWTKQSNGNSTEQPGSEFVLGSWDLQQVSWALVSPCSGSSITRVRTAEWVVYTEQLFQWQTADGI